MNIELIKILFSQFGIKEVPGEQDNPEILKYFKEIGVDESWIKDETAWCSAFANWAAFKAELPKSGKLNARSWLDVGEHVCKPSIGDIAVFWRESPESWKGHVAFFIRETETHVYVLGGNQNNSVSIKPYSKDRLLEYRRL